MKFAFLIMGNFDWRQDHAAINDGLVQIIGVKSIEEACEISRELSAKGIGCIELCGAFGEEGAKRVIDATQNRIPIGYVTHLPEQDEVYARAFGTDK